MKVRIKGNSLRYRLSMSDVAKFGRDGFIEEAVDFGKSQLTYALQKAPVQHLEAEFMNNKIVIFMPYSWSEEWVNTDRVGFDQKGPLYLLVEKDFQCIDNDAEDQSDNYPNPNLTC
ncbi:MAG: hypothetical protein JSU01_22355 [Bacteroidetes bacterium]|nr:hypothetical protein [Bacteroidota bacterium]